MVVSLNSTPQGWFPKPKKVEKRKKSSKQKKKKIVSLQAKISDIPFDQKKNYFSDIPVFFMFYLFFAVLSKA